MELTKAAADVLAERQRQIETEGWTESHDNQHTDRSLALAGTCYAKHYVERAWLFNFRDAFKDSAERYRTDEMPDNWRRDLVRAAALLIAEIERLDRQEPPDTRRI
jgi:hypothetical protein